MCASKERSETEPPCMGERFLSVALVCANADV